MRKINSFVAGISYPNSDGTLRIPLVRQFAHPGVPVFLVPEPKNKFDNHAIGLWIDTPEGRQQIGYVKGDPVDSIVPLNTDLLHQLGRSCTIICIITKVMDLNSAYPAVHLEYTICEPGETAPSAAYRPKGTQAKAASLTAKILDLFK
jgi:hypothetical protein